MRRPNWVRPPGRTVRVRLTFLYVFLLFVSSLIALAIMTIVSAALGWLVAGRALRPVRQMTAAAQRISEENLHERLAVAGPRDELKELGDTIDGLLGRLEFAFNARRRFVANASQELRTPLTTMRAALEQADPFTNTVTVSIGRLRRKLGDPPVISTTPGIGYRIADPSTS